MRRLSEYTGFLVVNRRAGDPISVTNLHFNDSPPGDPARRVRTALRDLNAFLFPRTCAACEDRPNGEGFFCRACGRRLAEADSEVPSRLCPAFHSGLSSLRSLWYTEPGSPARAAIHAVKYGFCPELAAWMGSQAAGLVTDSVRFNGIVPVPIHKSRRLERGFNQAEQIAEGVAGSLCLPILPALRRARPSLSQTSKTSRTRRLLPPGTFLARTDVAGKRLLLVDDVVTTGTTLNSAAAALLEAGAVSVDGLTVAVSRRPGAP